MNDRRISRPSLIAAATLACAWAALTACVTATPLDDPRDDAGPVDTGAFPPESSEASSPGAEGPDVDSREAESVREAAPTACAPDASAEGVGVAGCPCPSLGTRACESEDAWLECELAPPVPGTLYEGPSYVWAVGGACAPGFPCDPTDGLCNGGVGGSSSGGGPGGYDATTGGVSGSASSSGGGSGPDASVISSGPPCLTTAQCAIWTQNAFSICCSLAGTTGGGVCQPGLPTPPTPTACGATAAFKQLCGTSAECFGGQVCGEPRPFGYYDASVMTCNFEEAGDPGSPGGSEDGGTFEDAASGD